MTSAGGRPTPAPTPNPGSSGGRQGSGPVKPITGQSKPVGAQAAVPGVSGPLSGRKIGAYKVTEQIGKGGMGVVYRAHDTALDRTVAIKILPAHLSGDEDFVKRFIREARSAARLDHPNIVQVFQAGRMVTEGAGGPGPCFIAMQYFDGRPLSDLVSAEGRLDPVRALDIARQVAEGLAAAHAAGIVHRDIKSSNILVGEHDRVKVTDFGLATCMSSDKSRITQTGAYLGTPEYSSPEQCEGLDLDGRSDIYSLGVVLYEMLTGRVPFEAATPLKLFDRIAHEAPEPISRVQPGLPKELSALVNKMLAKRRDDRHATAEELLSAIRRVKASLGTWKRGVGGSGVRRAVSGGSRGAIIQMLVAAAVLVALGVVGFVAWRHGKRANLEPADGPVAVQPPTANLKPPAVAQPDGEVSVVIFDLVDRTGNSKDWSWACAGVPDMLISELKRCQGLSVYSRQKAAEALKSSGAQDAAARQLGARLIVSGWMFASGGRVRIDLTVADTATGKVADAVNEECADGQIFDLVNKLGRKLRENLDQLLAGQRSGKQSLAAAPSRDVQDVLFLAAADVGEKDRARGEMQGLDQREASKRELAEGAAKKSQSAAAKAGDNKAGAGGGYGKLYDGQSRGAEHDAADAAVGSMAASKDKSAENKRASNAPPAPPATAAKPGSAGPRENSAKAAPVVGGTLTWNQADGKEDAKEWFRKKESPAEVSVGEEQNAVTVTPAEKTDARRGLHGARVEALSHYYKGLMLLDNASGRDDYNSALAEFSLAGSVSSEVRIAGLDEAVKRANEGLDTCSK